MSLIVDDAGDILGGRVGDQEQQQSGDDGDEGNAIPAEDHFRRREEGAHVSGGS